MKKRDWRDKRDNLVPKGSGFGEGVMNQKHFDLRLRLTRFEVESLSLGAQGCFLTSAKAQRARLRAVHKLEKAAQKARYGGKVENLRKDRPEDRYLKKHSKTHKKKIDERR